MTNLEGNYWGKYQNEEPVTHYDPLQTFIEDGQPIGFRVNFIPGRAKRPREQHIEVRESYLNSPILDDERDNSPLSKVIDGLEPCVPIAGDSTILGTPSDEDVFLNLSEYNGVSIMNKYSPLGLYSKQANGVALVNYPTQYIRSLSNPQLNFDLLLPMSTSLRYLLENNKPTSSLKSPIGFFNIGPSSGSSLKYLHSQSYAIPRAQGLNSYAYQRAFEENEECLGCRIANEAMVSDHLDQRINYSELTVWEDKYVRLIIPYAPFRTLATRIIPKQHYKYIGNVPEGPLKSIANALTIADFLMNSTPKKSKPQPDRTIPFRQSLTIETDFHMFIDVLPPFPILAAESADFLGLTPYHPLTIVERMRKIDITPIQLL